MQYLMEKSSVLSTIC